MTSRNSQSEHRIGRRILCGSVLGWALLRWSPALALGGTDWALVLANYVDAQGRVDFRGLAGNPAPLDRVVADIAGRAPNNDPASFPNRADALAFHLNAYNALAMAQVLRFDIPDRLSMLGRLNFFKLTQVTVGGMKLSLYDYEKDVIRAFGDERVHFALNCMSVSCPRLPRQAFAGATLDRQLAAAADEFLNEPRNVRADDPGRVLHLTAIFDFYTADFLARSPTLIAYVNRYRHEPIPDDYRVEFLTYDWTINTQPITVPRRQG